MKIISFDVGIKNLAYCIINVDSDGFSIHDWNIINLLDKDPVAMTCNCMIPPTGSKKKQLNNVCDKVCGKKGKFMKHENIYCEKHALKCEFIMPNKECSPPSLKKMKINDLISKCNQLKLLNTTSGESIQNANKPIILDTLNKYFELNMLEPVKAIKKQTAPDADLIHIGRNMKCLLDNMPDIDTLTHVIIENQISTRMKMIQGMLAQYFIMKCSPNVCIEYISSTNKLKGFANYKTEVIPSIGEPTKDLKMKYKQHKKDGITICSQFIRINDNLQRWQTSMDHPKKKDDLADCFLQGIWYLKNENIITYAEDLKINSV